MPSEQKLLSTITLSNYDKILGHQSVIVKRNNNLIFIDAHELEMFENTYTPDGMLIANRIK